MARMGGNEIGGVCVVGGMGGACVVSLVGGNGWSLCCIARRRK